MPVLTVTLLIAATARLTRLLTTDALCEPARAWIERRVSSRISYLIRCDWCLSVWLGFATFTFGWYAPPTFVLISTGALTASLVTGWLATLDEMVSAKVWDGN